MFPFSFPGPHSFHRSNQLEIWSRSMNIRWRVNALSGKKSNFQNPSSHIYLQWECCPVATPRSEGSWKAERAFVAVVICLFNLTLCLEQKSDIVKMGRESGHQLVLPVRFLKSICSCGSGTLYDFLLYLGLYSLMPTSLGVCLFVWIPPRVQNFLHFWEYLLPILENPLPSHYHHMLILKHLILASKPL